MTTYLELRTKIARKLSDPDNDTFSDDRIKDMVQAAWAEIGEVAPERFQEDITPVADTLEYTLRSADFNDPVDEIEVFKVELWDGSQTPARPILHVTPLAAHPTGLTYSNAGWAVWGGVLHIPNKVQDMIAGHEDDYLIRVWGYSPWPPVTEDEDVVPFTGLREEALILHCRIEALRDLVADRELFKQWQTRSNNSDITPAGLYNGLNIAEAQWQRKRRQIWVMRETP